MTWSSITPPGRAVQEVQTGSHAARSNPMSDNIQITLIEKSDGPLTKKIKIDHVGSLMSDASACVMTRGTAHRLFLSNLEEFASVIGRFQPQHAAMLPATNVTLAQFAGDSPAS